MTIDELLAACEAGPKTPWARTAPHEYPDWACVYCGNVCLLRVNVEALANVEAFRKSHRFGTPEYDRGPEVPAAAADAIVAARNHFQAALRCLAEIREHCDTADETLGINKSLELHGFVGTIRTAIERFEAGEFDSK